MLSFIGNVCMPHGFPISGEFGESIACIHLLYVDGDEEDIFLRYGYEITTACGWYGPFRINPVASNAPRALCITNDPDREHYVVNMFCLPVKNTKGLDSIRITVLQKEYDLLYGLTKRMDGR